MAQPFTITPQAVRSVLQGRGRWLHAGNDNLPGYLAHLLGHRSREAKQAVRTLLLSGPEGLVVDLHPTLNKRITMVGLPEWVTDSCDVEEIPSDDELLAGYSVLIAANEALQTKLTECGDEIAKLTADLLRVNGDLYAAMELLEDSTSCSHGLEIAELKAQLDEQRRIAANARSAAETVRRESAGTIQGLRERIAELMQPEEEPAAELLRAIETIYDQNFSCKPHNGGMAVYALYTGAQDHLLDELTRLLKM